MGPPAPPVGLMSSALGGGSCGLRVVSDCCVLVRVGVGLLRAGMTVGELERLVNRRGAGLRRCTRAPGRLFAVSVVELLTSVGLDSCGCRAPEAEYW